jgi:hypothetical protein
MPLGHGHTPGALGVVPHQTAGLGWSPGAPANLAIIIASYLIVVIVLLVLGVLGWQGGGRGGGNGGGGSGRPPRRDLPPPGGRELATDEPAASVHGADFAAWESQLQGADEGAADDQEHVPAGR